MNKLFWQSLTHFSATSSWDLRWNSCDDTGTSVFTFSTIQQMHFSFSVKMVKSAASSIILFPSACFKWPWQHPQQTNKDHDCQQHATVPGKMLLWFLFKALDTLYLVPTFLTKKCFIQTGPAGSMFSMTAPITKVVKNDSYTAPRPPVPVAPTRPNPSTAAARSSAAALQPVSRTLQQSSAETSTATPTPPQVSSFFWRQIVVRLSRLPSLLQRGSLWV